jgi:hypothetical protein
VRLDDVHPPRTGFEAALRVENTGSAAVLVFHSGTLMNVDTGHSVIFGPYGAQGTRPSDAPACSSTRCTAPRKTSCPSLRSRRADRQKGQKSGGVALPGELLQTEQDLGQTIL